MAVRRIALAKAAFLFRLEMTPKLCFVRVAAISNRWGVPVRKGRGQWCIRAYPRHGGLYGPIRFETAVERLAPVGDRAEALPIQPVARPQGKRVAPGCRTRRPPPLSVAMLPKHGSATTVSGASRKIKLASVRILWRGVVRESERADLLATNN